jgi:hypothetical protein
MYILIYVDDIIITYSQPSAINELLKLLNVELSNKDMGKLLFFFFFFFYIYIYIGIEGH